MERMMQYQGNPRINKNELKNDLKDVLENKGVEDLAKFLNQHRKDIQELDLLNQPADNKNGVPLHFACRNDDWVERIKMLIEKGADLEKADNGGRTILHIACTRNCLNIVKFCIDQGMEIDLKNNIGGTIPLTIAVFNGNYEITKYLLEKGADFTFEFNKMSMQELADSQHNDQVTEIVTDYITKDNNWKRRKALLQLYINKTPFSKLRMYLFRKVALYA